MPGPSEVHSTVARKRAARVNCEVNQAGVFSAFQEQMT